jgi:hypothetical protein
MDGIGQLKYRVDADLHAHMKAIFGPDCWKDPEFTDALERDGIIQRVKGISDKIMSFAPANAGAGNPKTPAGETEAMLAEYDFQETELPEPSTEGTIDGTEVQGADQIVS